MRNHDMNKIDLPECQNGCDFRVKSRLFKIGYHIMSIPSSAPSSAPPTASKCELFETYCPSGIDAVNDLISKNAGKVIVIDWMAAE